MTNIKKAVSDVVDTLITTGAYRTTKYLSPTYTVKATRLHRPDKRSRSAHVVLSIGAPNFAERAFIKAAKKAGEPLPVKKVQIKAWPKKHPAKSKARSVVKRRG